MTQDEIIRMAREAGWGNLVSMPHIEALERFAALVAAHEREKAKVVFEELEREVKTELINAINGAVELEREACAKVCKDLANSHFELGEAETAGVLDHCAAAIRARGE